MVDTRNEVATSVDTSEPEHVKVISEKAQRTAGVILTQPDNSRIAYIVHKKGGKITKLQIPLSKNGKTNS